VIVKLIAKGYRCVPVSKSMAVNNHVDFIARPLAYSAYRLPIENAFSDESKSAVVRHFISYLGASKRVHKSTHLLK
jgi:hypothetical protein